MNSRRPEPPLVAGLPLLGSVVPVVRNVTSFLVESYLRHGPIFRMRVAHRRFVVLAGPEAALFFSRSPGAHYLGSRRAFKRMIEMMGSSNSVVTTDGQHHQSFRRMLRPAYSRELVDRNLARLGDVVETVVQELPVKRPLDVHSVMQRLIAEQLAHAVVGRSVARNFDAIVCFSSTLIYSTMGNFPALRQRLPRYRRARAALWELARTILDEHRLHEAVTESDRTIADIILAGKLEGQPLSETDLIICVLGPYLAGMDTAANTAAFLFYELLSQPALLERVVAEIDEVFSSGVPSAQALRGMRALRGAFLETLRVHPVGPAVPRHAVESFEFQGYRVEAGEEVLLAGGVSHFLPRFYPDPERFDIERHYEPRLESRQPGAFAPFGVGPHLCLGNGQAEIVTMLAVATLLRCARISLAPADYKLTTHMAPLPMPRGLSMRVTEWRSTARYRPAGKTDQLTLALPTLDRRVLAEVASKIVVRTYPAGKTIIRQGDVADRFFMILEGDVEVELVAPPGTPPRIVNRLGTHDYFGEIGLLSGATRSATVRATRETRLMELDRDGFMTMITESDLTSQEISRVMRQRVIATNLVVALPSLNSGEATALASRVKERRYSAGTDIIRQGEPADTFYVLMRGHCEVICRAPAGRDTVIGQMVEGDFFGEIGLLLGVPRTATVRAGPDTDAEVLALDADGFRAMVRDSQLAHEEIAQLMRRRLAKTAGASASG